MNLIESIKNIFIKNKNDSEGFYSLIRSEKWSNLLGKDQIKMIEGVIEVSNLQEDLTYLLYIQNKWHF